MAGHVRCAAEASGCLVAPAASKADVAEQLGQAGSIPVRLRQAFPRLLSVVMITDPPRQVPLPDALLAAPALAAAVERLGRSLVKRAVQAVQQRIRDGELAPDAAV